MSVNALNAINNRVVPRTYNVVLRTNTFPTSPDGLVSISSESVIVTYDMSLATSTEEALQIFCNGDTNTIISVTATNGFQATLAPVEPGDLNVGGIVTYLPEVGTTLEVDSYYFGEVTITYFDGVANQEFTFIAIAKTMASQIIDLPTEFVFADRLLGELDTQVIPLTNLISEDINLIKVELLTNTGSVFSLVGMNHSGSILTANSLINLQVLFEPTATTNYFGVLVVTTDHGVFSTVVKGTCKDAQGEFVDQNVLSTTYNLPVFPTNVGDAVNFTIPDANYSSSYLLFIAEDLTSPTGAYASRFAPLLEVIPPNGVFDLDFTYTKMTTTDSGSYRYTYLLF
jgi:hypothetical protein